MNYKYFISVYKKEKLQFNTPLSAEEITARLKYLIHPDRPSDKNYFGHVFPQGFMLRRIMDGNSRVNPIADGKISQVKDEMVVDLTISPNYAIVIYSLFLAVSVFITVEFSWGFVAYAIKLIQSPGSFEPKVLVIPVFWLFMGAILYFVVDEYNCRLEGIIADLERILEVPAIHLSN